MQDDTAGQSEEPTAALPTEATVADERGSEERGSDEGRRGRGRPNRGGPRPDRPKKRDVSGWVILDKGVGITSTHAVAVVKRAFNAKKAGHAGTLDPLASGILPIALGEATKTVPFVMDGRKAYRFTVQWGVETDTDDAEGRPVATSDARPTQAEVEAALPSFVGNIQQVPPRYSAIKIQGERAYDLAREGEIVELVAREVRIDHLSVIEHDGERTVIAAECGKGTYVRALARDLGRMLGCHGHVAALRRTRVGPFVEEASCSIPTLEEGAPDGNGAHLQPVETALDQIPEVPVSRDVALRLMRGQPVILRGRDAPVEGKAFATCGGILVAVGDVERGELVPHRVFHLGGTAPQRD
ncbi:MULTISPECIES: tRNA pseudouridine(55) synthase TruB [Methylobacterium]|uniref:tRNA pseudouridine synthase B n=1 Tax=Methylobacterium thuringiense TaxID=1003091 RepID=A0ABQ4TQK0_9HYPH|nr:MULTISPECIES: tRNA pseudouridine(55) synthase TruB [Methylobacterium]TXN20667.1 tRNA pseudouridine(55) synthase TruB [Methylobacterium sp. WL9]GJE56392.1 tRNA pseudouridine synthase B [Methylobacterium thuringiense]